MPTYDYECSSCGHRYEIFERVDANPLKKCPNCGKRKSKRQFGIGAGVVFKGSGFYTTDYARKGQKPKEGKEEKSPSKTEKKSEKKTGRKKKKTVRKKKD